MSINAFARLRALLPPSPTLIARVLQHHPDDTSTVELPQGLGQTTIAQGLAVGAQLRVRGTSVAVGNNAFLRDGVVQTRAPDGVPIDAIVGAVVALPQGPALLQPASAGLPPQVAPVGTPWVLDLAPLATGGYPPRQYTLLTGTLPAGLALDGNTGLIQGTATAATGVQLLTLRCEDSTHRRVLLPALSISAA